MKMSKSEEYIEIKSFVVVNPIEVLSSVLDNWVHGGDADCIIAEFEERLNIG